MQQIDTASQTGFSFFFSSSIHPTYSGSVVRLSRRKQDWVACLVTDLSNSGEAGGKTDADNKPRSGRRSQRGTENTITSLPKVAP